MFSSSSVRPYGFTQLTDPRNPTRLLGEEAAADNQPNIEAEFESARAEGLAQGYREGLQQALNEQQSTLERLTQIVERARLETGEFTRLLEGQVVALALEIARKVIEREVRTDPEIVLNVVRATINEVQDATSVHVRVHPQDHALIEAQWHAIGRNGMGEPIVLVADERVEPGGCLIETAIGHIDGQLSTRFTQVADLFEAIQDGEPA